MNAIFGKKISRVSHIEMEMGLLQQDQVRQQEDQLGQLADLEYKKRMEQLETGQGIYLGDVKSYFIENGEDVDLPFEVIEGEFQEWGVDVYSICHHVIQLDLPNMTYAALSLAVENQMSSIEDIGERVLLDVSAGSIFALNKDRVTSVYVSKGAFVGDSNVKAIEISSIISSSKLEIIDKFLEEQLKEVVKIHEPCPL